MQSLNSLVAKSRRHHHFHLIVSIVFILNAIAYGKVFFPAFGDIGVWDEATYINKGRELVERGDLPIFTINPAVAGVYAVSYLPVQQSPNWLVHTASIGRVVFFGLLWLAAVLVARQLAPLANPYILIALLTTAPPLGLLKNGSDALFASMCGLALWQFLSFERTHSFKHLWLCSLFVGVAALSRNEGPVLLVVVLALSLLVCIPAGTVRKGLTACLVPFVALVGGYVAIYAMTTGRLEIGTAHRSYLAFEQGHGMAHRHSFAGADYLEEGQLAARRIFGTPEENHYSVLSAIRRNPAAYFERIPLLTKAAIGDTLVMYHFHFGLICFWFAVLGVVELIKRRRFRMLSVLILWNSYAALYVLIVFQDSHLLIPFLTLYSLASVGISAAVLQANSARARYLWSAGLGVLAFAGAVIYVFQRPDDLLLTPLLMWLGLWLIWLVRDQFAGVSTEATGSNAFGIACLVLSIGMFVQFAIPHTGPRTLGGSADERAAAYLRDHFKEGARIGSWGPGKVWTAKMRHVEMNLTLRDMKSGEDVSGWMAREKVEAIYVDLYLRTEEPTVWDAIKSQIGNTLTVAFDACQNTKGGDRVLVLVPLGDRGGLSHGNRDADDRVRPRVATTPFITCESL